MAWQQTSGNGPVAGAHLKVRYRHEPWGTRMEVNVTGLQPGNVCQLQVTDATGGKSVVGSWRVLAGDLLVRRLDLARREELRSFQVTIDGKVVASAPAD